MKRFSYFSIENKNKKMSIYKTK